MARFVISSKTNLEFRKLYYHPVDKYTALRFDQTFVVTRNSTAKYYPDMAQRVSYFDSESDKRLIFLTKNFLIPALTVTRLCKCR